MPSPVAEQGGPLGISRPPVGAGRLGYAQLKQLWIQNGGNPKWAPTMAYTALLESGGKYGPNEINNNPSTGDLSAGLWQINYFGALGPSRTETYGPISVVASDPNANARAAVQLLGPNGAGISNWPNTGAPAVASFGGPLSDSRAQQWSASQIVPYGVAGSPGVPASAYTSSSSSGSTGCAAKGQVFAVQTDPLRAIPIVGGLAPSSSVGLTWCQVKAMTGAIIMVSGAALMVFGVAAIIVAAGLGGKAPAAAKVTAAAPDAIPDSAETEGQKIPERNIEGARAMTARERGYESALVRGRANARAAGPFPE